MLFYVCISYAFLPIWKICCNNGICGGGSGAPVDRLIKRTKLNNNENHKQFWALWVNIDGFDCSINGGQIKSEWHHSGQLVNQFKWEPNILYSLWNQRISSLQTECRSEWASWIFDTGIHHLNLIRKRSQFAHRSFYLIVKSNIVCFVHFFFKKIILISFVVQKAIRLLLKMYHVCFVISWRIDKWNEDECWMIWCGRELCIVLYVYN